MTWASKRKKKTTFHKDTDQSCGIGQSSHGDSELFLTLWEGGVGFMSGRGDRFCQQKVILLAAVTGWYPDSALSGILTLPRYISSLYPLEWGAQQPRKRSLWGEREED